MYYVWSFFPYCLCKAPCAGSRRVPCFVAREVRGSFSSLSFAPPAKNSASNKHPSTSAGSLIRPLAAPPVGRKGHRIMGSMGARMFAQSLGGAKLVNVVHHPRMIPELHRFFCVSFKANMGSGYPYESPRLFAWACTTRTRRSPSCRCWSAASHYLPHITITAAAAAAAAVSFIATQREQGRPSLPTHLRGWR